MTAIQDKVAEEFDDEKAWNYIKNLRDKFDKEPIQYALMGDLTNQQIKELKQAGYNIRKISKDEI